MAINRILFVDYFILHFIKKITDLFGCFKYFLYLCIVKIRTDRSASREKKHFSRALGKTPTRGRKITFEWRQRDINKFILQKHTFLNIMTLKVKAQEKLQKIGTQAVRRRWLRRPASLQAAASFSPQPLSCRTSWQGSEACNQHRQRWHRGSRESIIRPQEPTMVATYQPVMSPAREIKK